jgi:hypothetical protein
VTGPVDWSVLDVESRAAISQGQQFTTPSPVIHVTPEGHHPLGDPTRWGGTVRQRIGTDATAQNFLSEQIVRAQVMDHRTRMWRWHLQLESFPVPDVEPGISATDFGIEWTVGVGTNANVQRLSLSGFTFFVSAALGWLPVLDMGPGRTQIWFRSFGGFTDIHAEALSARFYWRLTPLEGPVALDVEYRMQISPESIGS